MRTRSRSNSSRTSTKSVKSAAAAEVEATKKNEERPRAGGEEIYGGGTPIPLAVAWRQ